MDLKYFSILALRYEILFHFLCFGGSISIFWFKFKPISLTHMSNLEICCGLSGLFFIYKVFGSLFRRGGGALSRFFYLFRELLLNQSIPYKIMESLVFFCFYGAVGSPSISLPIKRAPL